MKRNDSFLSSFQNYIDDKDGCDFCDKFEE